MESPQERIVVVRNPASSHASNVQHDVMDRLGEYFPSSQLQEFWTPSANKLETIDALSETMRPGDTVIVAAGDGTGNAAANAYMQTDSEGVRLGFLPYGNFNDMAATFSGKATKKDPLRLLTHSQETAVHPLDIAINGEHYRHALLYTTLGWTARAAAVFDGTDARQDLQSGSANLFSSLTNIAQMYFKTRTTSYLPPFYREGDDQLHTNVTDVLAVNGPIMAKIIRSQVPFYEGSDFLRQDLDVSSFFANTNFLGRSGLNFAFGTNFVLPGERTGRNVLHFNSASIPLQLDGESERLSSVDELSITKDQSNGAKTITVLQTT